MTIGPDLKLRAISGVVMALAAIGSDLAGGWFFALLWIAVFTGVAVEWQRIIIAPVRPRKASSPGQAC